MKLLQLTILSFLLLAAFQPKLALADGVRRRLRLPTTEANLAWEALQKTVFLDLAVDGSIAIKKDQVIVKDIEIIILGLRSNGHPMTEDRAVIEEFFPTGLTLTEQTRPVIKNLFKEAVSFHLALSFMQSFVTGEKNLYLEKIINLSQTPLNLLHQSPVRQYLTGLHVFINSEKQINEFVPSSFYGNETRTYSLDEIHYVMTSINPFEEFILYWLKQSADSLLVDQIDSLPKSTSYYYEIANESLREHPPTVEERSLCAADSHSVNSSPVEIKSFPRNMPQNLRNIWNRGCACKAAVLAGGAATAAGLAAATYYVITWLK